MSARIKIALAALGLAVIVMVAMSGLQQRSAAGALDLKTGTALEAPRPLPEFSLLDQHERPFTRSTLAGQWTLLFAGFTHCPDVCPATLATLTGLHERLDAAGVELRTVFLSLDPERDDPATLAGYVGHFSPDFLGATGAPTEIDKLMEGLGLAYIKVPGGAGRYTIDHSTALVLVDTRARVAAYFRPPHRIDEVAADLAALTTARR
jgi:protein SCO1/2